MLDRLAALEDEYAEVESRLADPAVISDQTGYAALARRYKELEEVVSKSRELRAALDDAAAAKELLSESTGDDRDLVRSELDDAQRHIDEVEEQLRLLLLPRDPNAAKNVIVEIRGAEGGEEANLFAKDLFEMYQAYAKAKGWSLEVLGADSSDMGGFHDITFLLKGDEVWTHMKYEGGPHRVQRVPETESQGRIHTSSATVTVLPEAEEVDVQIEPSDLQIDYYRSSGPGGQSVNTTDSAVRLTHKPTGVVVAMQDEKSQKQNREKAMRVLRSRLLKIEQDRQAANLSDQRRDQIGGGGRSEKIRTYNFKENRVTDHRVNLTLYRLDRILGQGDLDEVVKALLQDERTRQLQNG
jgi:peptide chain release factor 1